MPATRPLTSLADMRFATACQTRDDRLGLGATNQEFHGLEDGRLARVIRADQEIDAPEIIEVELLERFVTFDLD